MAKYKETALNYEALPAKGKYPALILASGVENEYPIRFNPESTATSGGIDMDNQLLPRFFVK